MNGLVEYASSDEEASERPTKENGAPQASNVTLGQGPHPRRSVGPSSSNVYGESALLGPALGPAPGPQAAPASDGADSANVSRPASPYTTHRRLIQNLTLPPIPNVSIPPSPPDSPRPSTVAKIEQFLSLKAQGVHFNAKLAASPALRNPSLLTSLMDFAGIDEEAQYASSLPGDLALGNERFDGWAFVENINQEIAKREKKRKESRTGVEFVSAKPG